MAVDIKGGHRQDMNPHVECPKCNVSECTIMWHSSYSKSNSPEWGQASSHQSWKVHICSGTY